MSPSYPFMAVLAVSALGGLLRAQQPAATVPRLPPGQRIVVDGRLAEPAWQHAVALGSLTQVDPFEGEAPSQRTEVRLCYDRDYLYLSMVCFEEPGEVRDRLMDRDARLDPDDRVEWWIDTFGTQRFGYWFQIGAGGSKGDALLSDAGSRFNKSWDGIWYGRARVTERGWEAEVALPFKTLAFADGVSEWGFNVRRLRKANDEETRWASPQVGTRFFAMDEGGLLRGLQGMRHGHGLDVVPYVKGSLRRQRSQRRHFNRLGDAGLDLNYRITPALNYRLTYNTDFAETEVDERQVNLTRFPLFFPEKRDFFLEDAGLFEFGPSGISSLARPFFSRRIGRDSAGRAVPILLGNKLTGRLGDWSVGALQVWQDEHIDLADEVQDDRNLGVLRVSRALGGEGAVGLIGTVGQPEGEQRSATVGADFHLAAVDSLGPGQRLDLRGYYQQTQNEGPGGDGASYGLEMSYTSARWNLTLSDLHVEDGYQPKLGFVRRRGIRRHRVEARYTWRNPDGESLLRSYSARIAPTVTTIERGTKDSWAVPLQPLQLRFKSDDRIEYEIHRIYERLREDFEISPGVVVPVGDYTVTNHFFEFETAERREFRVALNARVGDFYDGNLTSWGIRPTWLPNEYLRLAAGYAQNRVRLDGGNFSTNLYNARVELSFDPRVSWKSLAQYDTESKGLSLQSRLHWILEPGRELYLVGLQGWQRARHSAPLVPDQQELALKLGYTLRF